jgi:TIR domain
LEAWLQKQPREVSVALAARAALRFLAAVQQTEKRGGNKGGLFSEVVLPVFRATAVSWAAAKYPARETEIARAATAAARAAKAAAESPTGAYHAAAIAATRANAAARAAAATATATATSAITAAATAATDVATGRFIAGFDSSGRRIAIVHPPGAELSIDATRLEKGAAASVIAGSPLWPNGQPEWLQSLWQELKAALLAAKQDWNVWTIWYEDRLEGLVREEERELAYVRIDNDLWDQGPAIVNAEIKRRIEAYTAPRQEHPVLAVASKGTTDSAISSRVEAAKRGFAAARRPVFKGFFSYTHRDGEVDPHIVDAFSSQLEKYVDTKLVNARFEIWRDKEKLQLGDYWDQRIGSAINTSHIFIVLLTPKWISSDYCRKEFEAFEKIEAAQNSGGYVIPIYARDIERQAKFLEAEQKELLDRLKRIQYQQIIPKQFARLSDNERIYLIEGVADPICDILDRLRG